MDVSAVAAIHEELDRVARLAGQLTQSVTIFGSARISRDSQEFALAHQIAFELAARGYAVVSGGGPGIMRAASEGAKAGGGIAIGMNITLPFEIPDLSYQDISLSFDHLFTRKHGFASCSHGFVAMPGGLGTLDEVFDILARIKTQKLPPRPIALVGRLFWSGLVNWLEDQLLHQGLVHKKDIDPLGVWDTVADTVRFIESALKPPPAL